MERDYKRNQLNNIDEAISTVYGRKKSSTNTYGISNNNSWEWSDLYEYTCDKKNT